ncbi:N-acetylmuramoyl-L-alanine amidase family protein [Clostridium beijerinckii]|uniref:N-acetylmuramoyl-L-alanine amidase family protein n=2 Tax=Clostridium TaxID=1485 RepID=UPI0019D17B8C|nr:N-acetylmuramoyl-L-alanine amidase family protein [Clostridium beijerinckii]MBN7573226.1 N-acetylmuramoyl-L-alanine amidase family protein [Clostridium beijerinckii]MBN7578565.1 N-acetylmuramoyl-L-alanine amidase family protein [Clostridium beijerinckii]MBN7583000.1 N-acetylmuramoyl-L-alanine amidase family protein [Clostridium beijerinckii]MBO0519197.1 N-acetylmuramoyl-L-alanine amidase family protein [Clostridium beijerinckii]
MFKRANKITSLLVAAASVMALVPAYAADVKKIDSEDGTVYDAVAYKDGKFYVDGEINDDEEAYYVADGKFNKLEDVDSGDDADLFGEKYLDVSDGDYTVDLDKGSVTDDDVKGDTADDAASALRKKIKDDTDDRYVENGTTGYSTDDIKDENDGDTPDLSKLNIVPGAKYAEPWYYTAYASSDADANKGSGSKLNVFTDTKGNYIDADYNLGKVKVETTAVAADGKKITKEDTIENTNDKYDAAGADDGLKASVDQVKVLTQDKDYIYRLVNVTVKVTKGDAIISEINGLAAGTGVLEYGATKQSVTFPAIQKISKAQNSDEVDGAKYAKSVTTYALSNDSAETLDDAGLFTDDIDAHYTVVGTKLVAYTTDKSYTGASSEGAKVLARAYTLKSKSSYYYADSEDQTKEDCEVSAQDDKTSAVQTDVDGNLWRLDGGYIYKFDGTDDWDKVFKVDGSFDELSVYDKDNMVAWSEDDDVYSLIGGKSADENNGGETTTPVTTAGWTQTAAGWTYTKADGTKATGWLQDGGAWYYLKADGTMATGWVQDGATWYYLNGSGAMQTGWLNDNGTWYYLNGSGAMLANTTTPDGYYVGANGAWVK